MNPILLDLLRCPESKQKLRLDSDKQGNHNLVSLDGKYKYPVINDIPRFVSSSNYADNFGMQWNHFAKTQLDSYTNLPISADRFWKATAWNPAEMRDKWVLDVGCGSGRFAEIALSSGAYVVALDYSGAVDACWDNLKHNSRLYVVQGDIYALPFAPESFDFVYSLGVLQHTPNVAKAYASLPPMARVGGKICVDYYEKSFKSKLLPKYWLRPITKSMPKQKLFGILERWVPALLKLSITLGRIPKYGNYLKRFIPVANYEGILPLNNEQLLEWALLDTFDWLSPTYDNPQTASTVLRWMEQAGLHELEVLKAGHLVARGIK
jgi:SAM-dependent methyltransferase